MYFEKGKDQMKTTIIKMYQGCLLIFELEEWERKFRGSVLEGLDSGGKLKS